MSAQVSMALSSRTRVIGVLLAAALGALLVLLVTRSAISHPPMYDELLHVLSARGVVATGEPAIDKGVYPRAELYTRLVAAAYELRGESLESARWPAQVAAALLALLTGAWVAWRAGFIAGASASTIVAISVTTIEMATFARFYTLHALAALLMFIGVFELLAPRRPLGIRLVLALIAGLGVVAAFHLQSTTIIAFGAVGCGAVAVALFDRRDQVTAFWSRRPIVYSLLVLAVLVAAAFIEWWYGIVYELTLGPVWSQGSNDDLLFYLRAFSNNLSVLWPLFPLAALFAILERGRFGVFCVVVVLAILAVHSVAAAKASRYIYYILPMLAAVLGCGVSTLANAIAGRLQVLVSTRQQAMAASLVLIAGCLGLSSEGQRALRFAVGKNTAHDLGMYRDEPDWAISGDVLAAAADTADTIVVSAGVKGLYYFGRYDYELNASTVPETESGEEFGRDSRTGHLIVSTRESLARILDQSRVALIVLDGDKVGSETGVPADVIGLVNARCNSLPVDPRGLYAAWKCTGGGNGEQRP